MIKKIKFRAWDKKTNKMYPVDSLAWDLSGNLEEVWLVGVEPDCGDEESHTNLRTPDEVILEQSTGSFDRNDKEVCEGDIIEVVNVHDGDEECWTQPYGPAIPQEVKWDEERLRWSFGGCGRILYAPEDFEVIGNIHENGELLGGEE